MIATTVLYKHMKNFILKDREHKALNAIYFDGERAIATNTNVLVVVKDCPGEPGYADVKGRKIAFPDGETPEFPDYTKPMIPEKQAIWCYKNQCVFDTKTFTCPWIAAMEFVAKISSKKDFAPMVVEYKDSSIYIQ